MPFLGGYSARLYLVGNMAVPFVSGGNRDHEGDVTPALPASGPHLLQSPGSLGGARRSCRHLAEAERVQKLPVYSFTVYSLSVGVFWSWDCSCVYNWG